MKIKFGIITALIAIFCLSAAYADSYETYDISKSKSIWSGNIHKGHEMASDSITINRSGRNYKILYHRCMSPSHKTEGTDVGHPDAGLGFSIPGGAGWYLNNALEIYADSRPVTRAVIADYEVAETDSKDSVIIKFLWDAPEMTVAVTFIVYTDREGLFTKIYCSPKKELKSISMRLRCFPGERPNVLKTDGERWVMTASGKEDTVKGFMEESGFRSEPQKKMELVFPDDFWVLYMDKILDAATERRAAGPSAIVMFPECKSLIKSGTVVISASDVRTTLELPAKGASLNMVFYELPGMSNSSAIEFMKENSERINEKTDENLFDVESYLLKDIKKLIEKNRNTLESVDEEKLDVSEKKIFGEIRDEFGSIESKVEGDKALSFRELSDMRKRIDVLTPRINEFFYSVIAR